MRWTPRRCASAARPVQFRRRAEQRELAQHVLASRQAALAPAPGADRWASPGSPRRCAGSASTCSNEHTAAPMSLPGLRARSATGSHTADRRPRACPFKACACNAATLPAPTIANTDWPVPCSVHAATFSASLQMAERGSAAGRPRAGSRQCPGRSLSVRMPPAMLRRRVDQFGKALHVRLRADRLQDQRVGNGRQQMRRSQRVDRAVGVMRRKRDVVRLRQRGDLLRAGKPAAGRQVALQHASACRSRNGRASYRLVMRSPAAMGVLLRARDHRQVVRRLRRYRLFDEHQPVRRQRLAQADAHSAALSRPWQSSSSSKSRPDRLARGGERSGDVVEDGVGTYSVSLSERSRLPCRPE